MAELKTKVTKKSVAGFIAALRDPGQRRDSRTLLQMFKQATKKRPRMWGSSIVGFGDYRYKYGSGREGDWFVAGFSPRKQALTLYCILGFKRETALMRRLGKYKTGMGCLYIRRLDDVDTGVLKRLIQRAVRQKMPAR